MTSNLDNKKCNGLRLLLRGPYPPPYGGIASLIVSLLPGMRDYGADDVVVLHYGTKNEKKSVDGATVYGFDLKSQVWRLLLPRHWKTVFTVFNTLRDTHLGMRNFFSEAIKTILVDMIANQHRSNVVGFYQSGSALELLPCRKIWGTSRGIALTVFGEVYDSVSFILSHPSLFQRLIDAPDVVLSSSDHCACSFKKIGVERLIEVIYVGVDFERFKDDSTLRTEYRRQLGMAEDAPILMFMGRFHVDMGLDSLINTIPALIQNNKNIMIILAGAKGPLCERAYSCEQTYPLNVKVINDVPFNMQPALYAAADIVLAPSRDQRACMGVSIKEAMAAARPTVATNSGGIPEAIIDGETGVLVPLNSDNNVDEGAFVQAIQQLIDDKARRLEMGHKARERAIDLFGEQKTRERSADVFMRIMPRD